MKTPKTVKITYSQGLTLSKNYQSWRCDAGIEFEVPFSEKKAGYARARKLVEEQLTLAVDDAKEILKDLGDVVNGKK